MTKMVEIKIWDDPADHVCITEEGLVLLSEHYPEAAEAFGPDDTRLYGMTPEKARELAARLVAAADEMEGVS